MSETQEMIKQKNIYNLLDVQPDASEKDLKKAWHEAARKYHPDKNPEAQATERFKEISVAYAAFMDLKKNPNQHCEIFLPSSIAKTSTRKRSEKFSSKKNKKCNEKYSNVLVSGFFAGFLIALIAFVYFLIKIDEKEKKCHQGIKGIHWDALCKTLHSRGVPTKMKSCTCRQLLPLGKFKIHYMCQEILSLKTPIHPKTET